MAPTVPAVRPRRPLRAGVRRVVAGVLAGALAAGCATPAAEPDPQATEPIAAGATGDPGSGPAEPVGPDGATDAAPAAASPSPEPVSVDPEVARRVGTLLARPDLALPGGRLAVAVRDARGRAVFDLDSTAPLLPASTLKLVTAAAALDRWGPTHRFRTHVDATATPGAGGVLDGDLVLVGDGDPVLATPLYGEAAYPQRPRTPLEDLAAGVAAAGVTRVTGDVVVTGVLPRPWLASGWKDEYLVDLDARRITGVSVDAGLRLVLAPGVELEVGGEPAAEERATPPAGTGASPSPSPAPPADPALRTFVRLPVRSDGTPIDPRDLRVEQSEEPARTAGAALRLLLAEVGVEVEGDVVVGSLPLVDGTRPRLASVASPPLAVLLSHTVRESDNHLADTLFRLLGRRPGDGSWLAGAGGTVQALSGRDLDTTALRLADGSGLSRDDRATAAFLADLDATMSRSRSAVTWREIAAVAGVEGTLRRRLRGTRAEGRLLAKTGSLDDVVALVGRVEGAVASTERYHLAVVANDVTGAERAVVLRLVDDLAILLAAALDGCPQPPAAPPAPTPSPSGTAGSPPAPSPVPAAPDAGCA
ncbi:MAG: D-alanyl-D-alanine carboxypeptidase/D-alanyl-D-alanine-endopeptidase [Actinomycetes bacterium]